MGRYRTSETDSLGYHTRRIPETSPNNLRIHTTSTRRKSGNYKTADILDGERQDSNRAQNGTPSRERARYELQKSVLVNFMSEGKQRQRLRLFRRRNQQSEWS